ncbi:MAG: histidine--tRNA ligase [Deltaproteobacteria bacterium]|nr:histidine--tRNA ligase [Deltaproteobacteria bacterium]
MAVFLPKGTRDFLPLQMRQRRQVIETVRAVFVRHGFEALETPAFERIETLTGKYGEEGDRLIYKILKRGKGGEQGEADLALRYDLTVPFARVLSMNQDLRLPFKRFQMQPVWRADRPQKGRFREFWQCDVDVAGSTSPAAEAECLAVATESLQELGFTGFTVLLNDRRILASFARLLGVEAREGALLVALDKLDKVGKDGVSAELTGRGFPPELPERLWALLDVPAENDAALDALEARLDQGGRDGVAALRQVLSLSAALGVDLSRVQVAPTLARGLDYYTGPVYEIVVADGGVGTVAGGGRYDGLIGLLSGREVPAVGIALGLERLLTVMEERGMFADLTPEAEVFVTVFSPALLEASLKVGAGLRARGIPVEIYLGDRKLKAQFKEADARKSRWVVVVGPDEATAGTLTLKDLRRGGQRVCAIDEAAEAILTG